MTTLTAIDLLPVAAITLGQISDAPAGLAVYGPLGIICLWLMYRDEKRSQQSERVRESIERLAHELRGLNFSFLMVQASYGPENLRSLAQAELDRKQRGAQDKRA